MSKKKQQKKAVQTAASVPEATLVEHTAPLAFGFDEMLGELEAIVAEAEVRLAQDASLA